MPKLAKPLTTKHPAFRDGAPDATIADGGGLYLQVRGVSRSWLFRYKRAGRERWMGLGVARPDNLAEARKAASRARDVARSGRDPIEERDGARIEAFLRPGRLLSVVGCIVLSRLERQP